MHPSRLLLIAALGCLAVFAALPAHADAPRPGDLERFYDSTFNAPVHVQAEVVTRPVFQFGWYVGCTGDAVVRTSFAGDDILRVGQRFRFSFVCWGAWFLHPQASLRKRPSDTPPFVVEGNHLRRGMLLELFLTPTSPDLSDAIFRVAGAGLRVIPSLSATPQFTPDSPRGAFYDARYLPDPTMLRPVPFRATPRPAGEMVPFPRRDVTVTYRSSAEPGREFVAAYSAAMQRVAMQLAGLPVGSGDRQIADVPTRMVTRIWVSSREYSVRMGRNGERVGAGTSSAGDETVRAEGRDTLAGHPCTTYRITPGRRGVQSGVPEALVCVTDDGLSLRRVEGGVTTEVTRVTYGPVDPDISVVPEGYRRVRGEDDVPGANR